MKTTKTEKNDTYIVNFFGHGLKGMKRKDKYISLFYGSKYGEGIHKYQGKDFHWEYYAHYVTPSQRSNFKKIDYRMSYSLENGDMYKNFKSYKKAKEYIFKVIKDNLWLLTDEHALNRKLYLAEDNQKFYEDIMNEYPELFI